MVLSFEENKKTNINVVNSTYEISSEHYKDGNKSLKWCFEKESEIFFNTPVEYTTPCTDGTDSKKPCFAVYLYCEEKIQGKINVRFWKGNEICTSFDVHLGFTGWRNVAARFLSDMQGSVSEDMDNISFKSLDATGTIFIDQMVTCNLVDPRSVVSSHQVPYINQWYVKVHKYWNSLKLEDGDSITPVIKDRYIKILLEEDLFPVKTKYEIDKYFDYLHITQSNNSILGRPVEFSWQREVYEGVEYLHTPDYADLKEYCEVLYSIAYHYNYDKTASLADKYIIMIKHLLDQGFGAGSSMGVLHHIGYAIRQIYPSAILMSDILKKSDLLNELINSMIWMSEFGTIFLSDINEDTVTVDTLNIQSQAFLIISILLNSSKVMMQFKDWIDFSCIPRPGLRGIFKDDGSMYHHCNHYTAYGMDALRGLMPVLYAVSGTQYDVSANSICIISKCLLAMRFYCERTDYPISMSGRHPTAEWRIHTDTYRLWALSEANRGNTEFVGVYLRLINNCEVDDKVKNFNLSPEPPPQGHLTLGRACASFHRVGETLVSVKGFSKYLWGHETLWSENAYGRYMSYGHLEIIKENHRSSGFSHDGFDWGAIPGSTAIHYPICKMKSNVYNLDEFSGIEEMLISDEAFAGGVDDGVNGMFAMKLHGHPKYDGSHRAIKSYVMHGKYVICLGSNIENNETDYSTHTILFQKAKSSAENAWIIEGGAVDTKGNYYYSPNEIILSMSHQQSVAGDGKTPTEGDFWQGYINHGKAPRNGEYEYSITISDSDKPRYKVVQKDDVAHIVTIENTTYYAVFQPDKFKGYGKIQKTSHMLLAMVTQSGDGYELSVCQPDLGIYDYDESQYINGKRIEVSIYSRKWLGNSVKNHNVKIHLDNYHVINCVCEGGKSYQKLFRI